MSAESLVRRFEGCRLTAYPDSGGVWSIGFGHTGPEVRAGLVWTQLKADTQLAHDLAQAQAQLLSVSPSLSALPDALAALTDFVFNLGIGAYRSSTLARMVNAGNWQAARAQILLWDHVGGQVLTGLTRRRQAECALLPST